MLAKKIVLVYVSEDVLGDVPWHATIKVERP
ncbi:hypothetical protein SAMN05192586_10630 [Desulfovibrio legallii]|jgi:hypothetical protein|uniref:Uncharacterized protein n=1 Tax=Desulfovibrio legallii TaxID=571438 RepID=A0A1G7LED4_9BACT|nr:hypothetical protein SAMN05192586_10630 [Desulfovibrio legallii]